VIDAAVERAVELTAAQSATTVAADYFDRLVAALDRADEAPGLARAASKARRRPRIAPR